MKRTADSPFVVERMPSPTPSSSSHPPSPSADGPLRKRSRSEITPEERKEARAHRNRIAAQNSRDRRKAQFTYLERRVAELEEENRQLRAGLGVSAPSQSSQVHHVEKDLAREKENEELRARIKTLENGWEAVIKALAASGLPLNVPTPLSQSTASPQPATTSCPVIVPLVYPISPAPSTPSTSSHELELDVFEPTRHLAAGGFATTQLSFELDSTPQTAPTSAVAFNEATSTAVDEGVMEDLFHEILAPSPSLPSASLPDGSSSEVAPERYSSSGTEVIKALSDTSLDWEGEVEMQRLLDMLPDVQPEVSTGLDIDTVDFPSALELELSGWDMAAVLRQPAGLPAVGAF